MESLKLMNEISTFINTLFAIGAILIFCIAWFIKVEFNHKNFRKELDTQKQTQDEKINQIKQDQEKKDLAMWTKIDDLQKTSNSTMQIVARIEGRLSGAL